MRCVFLKIKIGGLKLKSIEIKNGYKLTLIYNNKTHAKAITTKSSQFHASLRYVNGHKMKPRAITLTADSNV